MKRGVRWDAQDGQKQTAEQTLKNRNGKEFRHGNRIRIASSGARREEQSAKSKEPLTFVQFLFCFRVGSWS
jgi:hypothetical protein